MRVDNKAPYRLIFSISQHPKLGIIVEPFVVALTNNFNLSLNHQKLTSLNAPHFDEISPKELDLIRSLDFLVSDNIVKRFSPEKKIRPQEYFKKYWKKEIQDRVIRPYIEEKLNIFFNKLLELELIHLYVSHDFNPADKRIHIEKETAKVLFHFRRDAMGTNYFVTLKAAQKKVFIDKDSIILTQQPCWMVSDQKLLHFQSFVEGSKLSPFIRKKFIAIKPEQEEKYFQVFVKKLLENFPVYAEGFDIIEEQHQGKVSLVLTPSGGEKFVFNLSFTYGHHKVFYGKQKMVHATYERINDVPTFTKIKRSQIWEENWVKKLKEQNLDLKLNTHFVFQEGKLPQMLQWRNSKASWLKDNNIEILLPDHMNIAEGTVKLNYSVKEKADWFDVDIWVEIGDYKFPFKNLRQNIQLEEPKYELPDGKIFVIPEEWFATFSKLPKSSDNIYKIAKFQTEILNLIKSDKIKSFLKDIKKPIPYDPSPHFLGTLRPYQKEGLAWIMFLFNNRFGGILADDMGLGKTIQTLAFIQLVKYQQNLPQTLTLFEAKETPKITLLVAPTSLLYNWYKEAQKFTPDLKVLVHSGYNRMSDIKDFSDYDVVITSYGLVRNDFELFSQITFQSLILDESQNIKNPRAKSTQMLRKLKSDHRLALTGTPIENTLKDLWSQINFLNYGLLGSEKVFMEYFLKPIEKEENKKRELELKKRIGPFVLRRTKKEVAKDLPDLTEKIVFCEMTEDQESLYDAIKSKYRNELLKVVAKEGLNKSKLNILSGLTKLRQIANHPHMIEEGANISSGKHNTILEHLKTAKEGGHKVLVFSQFVSYLNLLAMDLRHQGVAYYLLDGTTKLDERQRQIDAFQGSDGRDVFLISLKAGGTGLNLTAADYVFIVDPWWNPAVEQQARDRTHRIGQNKKVFSYRFISKDTVEEKIVALQKRKTNLAKEMIVSGNKILEDFDEKDLYLFFD